MIDLVNKVLAARGQGPLTEDEITSLRKAEEARHPMRTVVVSPTFEEVARKVITDADIQDFVLTYDDQCVGPVTSHEPPFVRAARPGDRQYPGFLITGCLEEPTPAPPAEVRAGWSERALPPPPAVGASGQKYPQSNGLYTYGGRLRSDAMPDTEGREVCGHRHEKLNITCSLDKNHAPPHCPIHTGSQCPCATPEERTETTATPGDPPDVIEFTSASIHARIDAAPFTYKTLDGITCFPADNASRVHLVKAHVATLPDGREVNIPAGTLLREGSAHVPHVDVDPADAAAIRASGERFRVTASNIKSPKA